MTFGKRYKNKTFQTVIEATALQNDLQILPEGEMTEIGEKVFLNFFMLKLLYCLLSKKSQLFFLRIESSCLWLFYYVCAEALTALLSLKWAILLIT